MKTLWHTTSIYMHPKVYEYAEKLTATLPGELNVVYFVNSGSEANDLAMLLARLYTRNHDIITLKNAYHGASTSTMGLTGCFITKKFLPQAKQVFKNIISSAICMEISVARGEQWRTSCYECGSLYRPLGRKKLP